jgi:hypothetical protein
MKKVKLVLGENGQRYLISDDEIVLGDEVCELLTTGNWLPMTIHTLNDIDKERQKKIIMYGDEIGWVVDTETFSSRHFKEIEQSDIFEIIGNNGDCYLDMLTIEGDYCGVRIPTRKENKGVIRKGV